MKYVLLLVVIFGIAAVLSSPVPDDEEYDEDEDMTSLTEVLVEKCKMGFMKIKMKGKTMCRKTRQCDEKTQLTLYVEDGKVKADCAKKKRVSCRPGEAMIREPKPNTSTQTREYCLNLRNNLLPFN